VAIAPNSATRLSGDTNEPASQRPLDTRSGRRRQSEEAQRFWAWGKTWLPGFATMAWAGCVSRRAAHCGGKNGFRERGLCAEDQGITASPFPGEEVHAAQRKAGARSQKLWIVDFFPLSQEASRLPVRETGTLLITRFSLFKEGNGQWRNHPYGKLRPRPYTGNGLVVGVYWWMAGAAKPCQLGWTHRRLICGRNWIGRSRRMGPCTIRRAIQSRVARRFTTYYSNFGQETLRLLERWGKGAFLAGQSVE